MTCNDTAFWQARIDKAKATIVLYEDALDALLVQGVLSYSLDTGQSKQTVTKQDIKKLEEAVDSLMNRIATLQARVSGCGNTIAVPGC